MKPGEGAYDGKRMLLLFIPHENVKKREIKILMNIKICK